jgi:hypothetical protein
MPVHIATAGRQQLTLSAAGVVTRPLGFGSLHRQSQHSRINIEFIKTLQIMNLHHEAIRIIA